MATLTIGDKQITVDDSFRNLSPELQQRTVEEIASRLGVKSKATGEPSARPGSREYADWAAQEARAGRSLPQVSTEPPKWTDPSQTGIEGKFTAGFTSAANAVPIAGPTILDWLEKARASVQGMPLEDVQREGSRAREANPITSGIGTVAGTVGPFLGLGAVPGVGRLLGMSGGMGSQMMFGAGSGAMIGAADTKARGGSDADALGSAAIGGGVGGAFPILAKGIGAGWDALTRSGASKEARQIGEVLRADGIKATDLPALLKKTGPDAMVMDLGPNLQQQAGGLASTPGVAQKTLRDAIAARSKGDTLRVAKDVAETVGIAPDIDTLRTQIIADRAAAADPLYEAIREVPIPTLDGDFFEIFSTPLGKDALREGLRLAANDGIKFKSRGLTAGMVDYAKRALDDIASTAYRNGRNNAGRQAGDLARRLAAATDAIIPEYKAAREAFAGPSQILDAIETGTTVFTKEMSPTQLQSALQGMTAGERDALLQGAQHQVAALLGNSTNDVLAVRNLLRKPFNEGKLRILLGDDVTDDLLQRIDRQITFGQTANVVSSNSETARRLAAQKRVNPDMQDVGSISMMGLVLQAIKTARQSLRNKMQPVANAKQAGILSSGIGGLDPAMLRQLTNGSAAPRPLPVMPASAGLLAGGPEKRQPIEITVRGGR